MHHNPMWIHADTAAQHGIRTGDMVEITTYRPSGHMMSGGGTGAGYNVNGILPIQPAPLVGMQGWYDTVCSIRRV